VSAADAPVPRYRLEAGVEHHAMSGHGGDPVCEPVIDRRGEWVKWADVEAYIRDLTYTKDEQTVGREVDHTFSKLQERQLTLARKEAEMLRAERAVFEERTRLAEEAQFQCELARHTMKRRIEVLEQPSAPVTDQQLEAQSRLHAEQVQQLLGELVLARQNHAGSQAAAEREFARATRLGEALIEKGSRLAAAEAENRRLVALLGLTKDEDPETTT
jgi:hypothetical protein